MLGACWLLDASCGGRCRALAVAPGPSTDPYRTNLPRASCLILMAPSFEPRRLLCCDFRFPVAQTPRLGCPR
eukprot:5657426-Alexandrium_andersonii.AAC.1